MEIFLTPESQRSPYKESSISISCVVKRPGTPELAGEIKGESGDRFDIMIPELDNRLVKVPKLYVYPNSPSKKFDTSANSPSKKRRKNGEGNGTLYQKALVKNGKTYSQWWYQWKVGNKKRTKYVNKKVLGLVQELEERKAPVIEILKVLGVEQC